MIIALPTRLLYMLVSAFLVRAVDLGSSECCISQHYRDSRPGLCFRATTRTYKLDPKRNRSSSKPGASHPTPMYEWTRSFVLTFRLQPSLVVPVLAFFSSPSSADAAGGKKKKRRLLEELSLPLGSKRVNAFVYSCFIYTQRLYAISPHI